MVGIIQFSLACGIPAILSAIGFSASGPLLGSVAAGWQASIGSVAAGSLFAFLQSAAMGGTAVGLFNGIGALALLVAIGGRLATVEFVKEKFGEMAVKMGEVASVVKDGWQDLERSIGDLWRNAKNIFTKNSTSGWSDGWRVKNGANALSHLAPLLPTIFHLLARFWETLSFRPVGPVIKLLVTLF